MLQSENLPGTGTECHYEKHNETECEQRQQKQANSQAVAIILGYYNGSRFLEEQLQSISGQTHTNYQLFICDDVSEVAEQENLLTVSKKHEKLSVHFNEKNLGFCNNFLDGLRLAGDGFEYYAFSDQDDIWHPDKLERALNYLSQSASDKPALYCARTETVDETGKVSMGFSPLYKKQPSFANALVQNIGSGNSMVFNKSARDLIIETSKNSELVFHDWWAYIIVSGVGGTVYYDERPSLRYRQHDDNIIGANNYFSARLRRTLGLLQGDLKARNQLHIDALLKNQHLLSHESQKTLALFIEARQSSFFKKLHNMRTSTVHRQTLSGNIGLFIAALIRKV